jgi:putative nucleotidyltransferase with HDIG domain
MISFDNAVKLLEKYRMEPSRLDHSKGVSDIAFNLAKNILNKHPAIAINPDKIRIAALLHDIGRCEQGDHELNTLDILKKENLEDIASITIHGSIYEIMVLRGKDDPTLLPQTLENKIVAYADARFKDRPVTMEERWKEIEIRRSNEDDKITSLRMAKQRFFAMEKEIIDLL